MIKIPAGCDQPEGKDKFVRKYVMMAHKINLQDAKGGKSVYNLLRSTSVIELPFKKLEKRYLRM